MSIWNSSSLAFSDNNKMKRGSGLLKNLPTRISKQHLVEEKMFGSKRKGIQIGKNFKKSGKGIMKGSTSAKMSKEGGISPSLEEFDKMMSKVMNKKSGNSNKSMLNRKSFD